jgi:hypothetical protein
MQSASHATAIPSPIRPARLGRDSAGENARQRSPQSLGRPPLKWSDLNYGFDHGGEEEWLENGIVLKR